jgi:hypothetical protein
MQHHPAIHIEVEEIKEGLFRASCPELGLFGEGADMAEAEAAVMRLIDERTQQKGESAAPGGVESERYTRVVPDEREPETH